MYPWIDGLIRELFFLGGCGVGFGGYLLMLLEDGMGWVGIGWCHFVRRYSV